MFIHKLADKLIEFEQTTRFQRTTTAFGAYSATKKRKPHNIVHLTPIKKLCPTPGEGFHGPLLTKGWKMDFSAAEFLCKFQHGKLPFKQ